ncbi:methyltransferase domain-containing protein [Armatimonas sp.]|uniref:class I SAM-dependent methyltransferase n=1 Tax=Armatimonas sp. TaxID=1872638 RepID=UPI00374CED42
MTEATARFLVSEPGAALLARGVAALSKQRGLEPEQRAGALAVLEGRERARKRGWKRAEQLFLTADSLAQASSEGVAAFHAGCFVGCETVLDACCGIGRDSLALAEAGMRVVALDTDPARLVFARANADIYGVGERITLHCTDATSFMPEAHWDGVFFDPARRDGATRFSRDAERYQPPLSFLSELQAKSQVVVAKLSPALPDATLEALGGQLTFLSEDRTCKEACVVLGAQSGPPQALLLPGRERYEAESEPPPLAPQLGAFLLDPDPAVLRAGALGALAERTHAALLSPDDAYLTADDAVLCSGVRTYRVRVALPYRERTLGRWLREQGIGKLVVKKRRYPKEPDAVHQELGLKANSKGTEATLIIVAQGKSWLGVVCDPS